MQKNNRLSVSVQCFTVGVLYPTGERVHMFRKSAICDVRRTGVIQPILGIRTARRVVGLASYVRSMTVIPNGVKPISGGIPELTAVVGLATVGWYWVIGTGLV